MLTTEPPYYMTNEKWYKHNREKWRNELTEEGKKDPEVVKSYIEDMSMYGYKFDSNYDIIDDEN